ncbi:MAG: hypothetical protein CMP11_06600 [Zetaproteobacteria bacterium]|nr:hypothetical protein [Pseudobdellovibrionaceae bacterium]
MFSKKKPKRKRRTHFDSEFTGKKPKSKIQKPIFSGKLKQLKESTTDFLNEFNQVTKPQVVDAQEIIDLDPWQKEALEALRMGLNIVIDAPTTSGKTKVAEKFFAENLKEKGFKACYTCPVKSLSNDKLKEFQILFGKENVGIATGDIKENLSAPLIVSTLETYRNSLLGTEPQLDRSIVIFDEYHFLQDQSRGKAWEEAIILTPNNCQVVLMSASVDNPGEFVLWLEKITKRETKQITVENRPVPLTNFVWLENSWILADKLPSRLRRKDKAQMKEIPTKELTRSAKSLIDLNLSPCLIYCSTRLDCVKISRIICRDLRRLRKEEARPIVEELKKIEIEKGQLYDLDDQLFESVSLYGVCYHHSGLTPQSRFVIEHLLKKGLIRICCATMGLSLGVNFSVKSTLISSFTRPGNFGLDFYEPTEILQMTGRAGRRGRDPMGFNLWPSLAAYNFFANPKRQDCLSSLRCDTNTILGLISQNYSLLQIENFYKNSFLLLIKKKKQEPLRFILPSRLKKNCQTPNSPCNNPLFHFHQDRKQPTSPCPACYDFTKRQLNNPLTKLQKHLYKIKALTKDNKLTELGEIAKYFPQSGGLVLAKMISEGEITQFNLLETCELIGAMTTAFYKKPFTPDNYSFPFDYKEIEKNLSFYYPFDLFPDLYDPPRGQRRQAVFREFNVKSGFFVREWCEGTSWDSLAHQVTNQYYSQGDVIQVIRRVTTYIQSIIQLNLPSLSPTARELKDEILRDPIKALI